MEEHEYESLRQMQGSMNLARCANPKAYERANYFERSSKVGKLTDRWV